MKCESQTESARGHLTCLQSECRCQFISKPPRHTNVGQERCEEGPGSRWGLEGGVRSCNLGGQKNTPSLAALATLQS